MKWFCRRVNAFNNGREEYDEAREVPAAVKANLGHWIAAVGKPHIVAAFPEEERVATLITDASLHGWGAILVSPRQQIFVAGAQWKEPKTAAQINELEGMALSNALGEFRVAFDGIDANFLRVVVDNTSVQHALRRTCTSSEAMAMALQPAVDIVENLQWPLTVEYVESARNPADSISRGAEPQWAQALGVHARRGDRRADFCRVLPHRGESTPQ